MVKSISILGCTGSIGRQTIAVAEHIGMPVAALTANRKIDMLEEQARKESLSFQSLIEEMGDLPATEVRREEGGGAPGAPDRNLATGSLVDAGFLGMDGGTMPGDVDQPAAPRRKPNENDFRVLTGSSPKRTPIWLQNGRIR